MSTTAGPFAQPVPPELPVRRFSVDEYHRLIQTGILTPDDRVELLEGLLVAKMVRNPPHDACLELVQEALRALLPPGWRLRIQSAVTTGDSEPEPDVAVVRGPVRSHTQRHPVPSEVGLVVEVADASLQQDRNVKGPLYARAAIQVYWIVNLVDARVEVLGDPAGSRFRQQLQYGPGETVPVVLDGREIGRLAVTDLLP